MENVNNIQKAGDETHLIALNLFYAGKNAYEIKNILIDRGVDEQDATVIIESLEQKIADAKKAKAQKDMLYGALWCVGGIVLTMANIGFIFWGAIIFGAIQLIRGISNLS